MAKEKESKVIISRDQFKRLTENILNEASTILDKHDKADKSMDKESTLLKELLSRLCVKLGLPDKQPSSTGGFDTFGYAYESAIYQLLEDHSAKPFQYDKIVGEFLEAARRKK